MSAPWSGVAESLSREAVQWAIQAAATSKSEAEFRSRCEEDAAFFRWPELEARLALLSDVEARLAEWESQGIRMTTRFDDAYPNSWRTTFGGAAPTLYFAFGNDELLSSRAVGVVGSRDASPEALDFARALGERIAELGMTVVSGGARGVDSHAIAGAWEAGGSAVVVLGDSLERAVANFRAAESVRAERTLLLSPHLPSAPFSVGLAMGRNKLIYALSLATVVVCSAESVGGTWAGAKEALRKSYGRVWAWRGEPPIPGNEALLGLGATPILDLCDFERELQHIESPP